MARVSIEDSVDLIANRFRLVMCGAQRGRELASGVEPTVERDRVIKHEKNAVIALREIMQGNLDIEALEDSIVRNHRRFSPIEAAAEEGEEGGVGVSESLAAEGVVSFEGHATEVLPEIHAEAIFGAEAEEATATTDEATNEAGGEAVSASDADGGSDGGDVEVADKESS